MKFVDPVYYAHHLTLFPEQENWLPAKKYFLTYICI
jgi:hypothetical protein